MAGITIKVPETQKMSFGTTETSKLRKDINAHVADKSNPHDVTKAQLGLGNVDNVKQASKADFNLHKDDMTAHVMDTERNNWNDKYTRAEVDRTFEDFDGHVWSIIDESINESKDSLTTYVDEKNQASKADFDSHKNAEELDHPDNSVTYNKLSLEVQQMIESNDELIVAENFSELDKLNDIVILNTHEENVDFNNAIVFTNVGHEGTDYYQIALEYDVGNEGVVNVWSRKFNTQITQGSKWSKVLSKDEIITKLDEKNSEQDDAIDSNTITETAEGSAINITDSANAKLKGLRIFGKTTQADVPSIENPQELVSVGSGGNITAVLYGGSNMFDVKAWFPTYSNEFNGMSYSNKDFVTIRNVKVLEGRFLPNTQYTFSFDYELSVAETNGITVIMHDASGNAIKTTWINATGSQTGHTPTTNPPNTSIAYISLEYNTSSKTCDVVLKNMQINVGVAEETFEPFKSLQTATFSTPNGLPGVPVSSGGNYTDENGQQYICDEIDGDSYIHRVVKYTFDGSENWSYSTSGVSSFRLALPDIVNYRTINIANPMLCTHYPVESSNDVYSGLDKCATIFGQIWISDSRYTDLNSWKSALSELNLSAIFILKEPIEEPLADNEILVYKALRTNKTVTNIFNDVNAHMKIDYVADPKTYIDNKFAKVENAILSLGGNV